MVALLVLFTILTFLTVDYFVQRAARSPAAVPVLAPAGAGGVGLERLTPPADVFLSRAHAWLRLEPSGSVRVGTDALAPMLLGAPSRAQVRPRGTLVRRGQRLATLERDGRSVVVRSPVDGIVVAVNPEVIDRPERLRSDPFGDGWLARIEPSSLQHSLSVMRVARDAASWMRDELRKLRDALVQTTPATVPTLPDGGLPLDGVAEKLDAVAWEHLVESLFPQDDDLEAQR